MRRSLLLSLLPALAISLSAPAAQLTVTVENLSPDAGTWLTPFWIGFHDGGFDLYDGGSPASMGLERFEIAAHGATLGAPFSERCLVIIRHAIRDFIVVVLLEVVERPSGRSARAESLPYRNPQIGDSDNKTLTVIR